MTIEVTDDEYNGLILCMGMLAGMLARDHEMRFYRVLELTNALNRTNPRWTPYEIPPDSTGPLIARQEPNPLDPTSDPMHGIPR